MQALRIGNPLIRDIAQLGRAPALGAGCRRFKSYYPEDITHLSMKDVSNPHDLTFNCNYMKCQHFKN